jgi:hypothetical protein
MLINPGKFDFQLIWPETRGAQDTHTTSLGNFYNNIAAMSKGDQGKLDAEFFTDRRFHSRFLLVYIAVTGLDHLMMSKMIRAG